MGTDTDAVSVVFNLAANKRQKLHDSCSARTLAVDNQRNALVDIHSTDSKRCADQKCFQNGLHRSGLLERGNIVLLVIEDVGDMLSAKLRKSDAAGDGLVNAADIENQALHL